MNEDMKRPCPPKQHVHEVTGSVKISGCCEYAHNHRFATVSSDATPFDCSHVHQVKFQTAMDAGHKHDFIVATLIENPVCD